MIRKSEDKIFSFYIIFLVISLILIASDTFSIGIFIRYPFDKILIPPRRIIYVVKNRIQLNLNLFLSADLRQKITKSEESIKELLVLKTKIQTLEEENNSLRKQLECNLPAQWDFVPAHVLGLERYLFLNVGKREGITKNMVVVSENIVIGKIAAVNESSSQVMLLWDPEIKIPVTTDKNVRGLLIGVFGNQIKMSRILQKDPLAVSDLVLTSGEEGYPANLLIGRVDTIDSKKEEVYKEAFVSPLIDYSKLETVFIISKY